MNQPMAGLRSHNNPYLKRSAEIITQNTPSTTLEPPEAKKALFATAYDGDHEQHIRRKLAQQPEFQGATTTEPIHTPSSVSVPLIAPSKFKLRQIKWDYTDNRRTNDEIHSSIPLNPVVTCILDTPPMQRLRGLKQLGTAEFVYFNCNHSRFEHSVGVAHLAEALCQRIRSNQPSLQCTAKDVLCVQLAGLLHDIGHGPFSHCYEHFVKLDLPNHLRFHPECEAAYNSFPPLDKTWDHEDASLMMVDAILEHLGLRMDVNHLDAPLLQVGDGVDATSLRAFDPKVPNSGTDTNMTLTTRDWLFIKECICGSPIEYYAKVLGPGFHGRPREQQEWLYDIVANRHSGLDVDKIDYFARDQRRALKESGEINKVLMESAVVAWAPCTDRAQCHRCNERFRNEHAFRPNHPDDLLARVASAPSTNGALGKENHLMICFPKKLQSESVEFFRTRFSLHSKIYKHKTIEGTGLMLSDIFCLADPYFLIPTGISRASKNDGALKEDFDEVPISRAMHFPGSYLRLKDSVIDQIEGTKLPELEPARKLIERYRNRDLYKCAASKVLQCQQSAIHRRIWEKNEEEIVDEILMFKGQHIDEDGKELILTRDDMVVSKCDIHHGQKDTDPLTKMRFLEKNHLNKVSVENYGDLPVAGVVDRSEYASRLPRTLREFNIRIYARSATKLELLSHVFNQWWQELDEEMKMTVEMPDNMRCLPISQDYNSDEEGMDDEKESSFDYNRPDSEILPWCSPN